MATSLTARNRPRVLCVNNDKSVLEDLSRALRTRCTVVGVLSGRSALDTLEDAEEPFDVVVSDLRMPDMDGVELLREVRAAYPSTSRILVTDSADIGSVTAAINEGHIFRLLFRPVSAEDLNGALDAAVEHHRLHVAERELLEQTLRGSVEALVSTLAIASPATFARSSRVKRLAAELAVVMDVKHPYEVELAAMLSQIGAVALREAVVDKLNRGLPLTDDEEAELDQLPRLAERVLANIPRLDNVRDIVRYQRKDFDGNGVPPDSTWGEKIPLGARLLRVANDLDQLETAGDTGPEAIVIMRSREGRYDPAVLDAAEALVHGRRQGVAAVRVGELAEGMVLAHDLTDSNGVLVVGRGFTVTEALVTRLGDPAWRDRVPGPALVYC
ncbi:MAG: HD domain-containing phosphohydrolase [Acidimicrobiales bacterium]